MSSITDRVNTFDVDPAAKINVPLMGVKSLPEEAEPPTTVKSALIVSSIA
jgi:hypothetical protein